MTLLNPSLVNFSISTIPGAFTQQKSQVRW
jgi:hypothetical protein